MNPRYRTEKQLENMEDIIIKQWVAVKDQLPKFRHHVIVATSGGVTTGRLEKIDHNGQHWNFHEYNQIYWAQQKVYYWMDLPDAPGK